MVAHGATIAQGRAAQDLEMLSKLTDDRLREVLVMSIRYRVLWVSITSMRRRDSTQIGVGGGLLFIGGGLLMVEYHVTDLLGLWVVVPAGLLLLLSGIARTYRKAAKEQIRTLRAAADAVEQTSATSVSCSGDRPRSVRIARIA